MKVDFMIIGAQKCGTTTLYEILAKHPGLTPCRPKEPMYFCNTSDWKKHIDDYHENFEPEEAESEKTDPTLYFEGSTSTTFLPIIINHQVWESIYEYNPEMKFIYLVRHPIERIISSYMHLWQQGFTDNPDIVDTIIKERFYIDITRYHTQISPFVKRFGRDNVLIMEFEDFVEDKSGILKRIATFLGIDFEQFEGYEEAHWNKTVGPAKRDVRHAKPNLPRRIIRDYMPAFWERIADNSAKEFKEKLSLPEDIQKMILVMLENDIKGMEELLGKDLSAWREMV